MKVQDLIRREILDVLKQNGLITEPQALLGAAKRKRPDLRLVKRDETDSNPEGSQ